MNAMTFRRTIRWFHIFVGLAVGSYFYAPVPQEDWVLPLIKFVLIPLLALSGLALWQQARIMRWIK